MIPLYTPCPRCSGALHASPRRMPMVPAVWDVMVPRQGKRQLATIRAFGASPMRVSTPEIIEVHNLGLWRGCADRSHVSPQRRYRPRPGPGDGTAREAGHVVDLHPGPVARAFERRGGSIDHRRVVVVSDQHQPDRQPVAHPAGKAHRRMPRCVEHRAFSMLAYVWRRTRGAETGAASARWIGLTS